MKNGSAVAARLSVAALFLFLLAWPMAAIAREPFDIDRANLAFRRGQALFELADYVEALREFQNACILNPEFADSYYAKGLCLLSLDEPEKADEQFVKAVEIAPLHTAALYNLGLTRAQMGDSTAARQYFQRAISVDPGLRGVHFALAQLEEKSGNVEAAIGELKLELEINPDSAAVHADLGYLLILAGDIQQARYHLERGVMLDPDLSARMYLDRGRVEERDNNWEEAEFVYTRGLQVDSLSYDLWIARAQCRFHLEKYVDAATDYQEASRLKPEEASVFFNQGVTLELAGDIEAAMKAYEETLARDSTYAEAHLNLAALLGKSKQKEEAIHHLETYLELEPDSPRAADVEAFLDKLKGRNSR